MMNMYPKGTDGQPSASRPHHCLDGQQKLDHNKMVLEHMTAAQTRRKRAGRRPGVAGGKSRAKILGAARQLFARYGFRATTTRAIAAKAAVDAALVHYFFQTKARLFAAAIDVPVAPEQLKAVLMDSADGPRGERVARFFLEQVFTSRSHAVTAMIRAAVADPGCIPTLRSTIENTVVTAVASVLRGQTARLRAELLGAQIVGMFIVRHIVRVEPIASASTDAIAKLWGPAVDVILGKRAGPRTPASQ
jgi:AcrR family transcriptional regulator